MLAKKAVVAIGTISVGTNSTMQHRYQLFGPCARVSHAIKKAKTELNDLGRWFVMCHGVHPIYVGPVSEIRKKKIEYAYCMDVCLSVAIIAKEIYRNAPMWPESSG